MRFLKKVIVVAIIAVTGYTVIHLIFNWCGRDVQPSLTAGWFGFWGLEIFKAATIKMQEEKHCKGGDN